MFRLKFLLNLVIILYCCFVIACANNLDKDSGSKETQPTQSEETITDNLTVKNTSQQDYGIVIDTFPALHNLIKITGIIYSGSQPNSYDAFASLVRLGISTVVSVDGAKPDLETASKFGLRYVHIPIGYDGIDKFASSSLTRLVREAEGPYYIHCHHGVHRGPAAAAIAAIAAGDFSHNDACKILELAGTSESYVGLWRDVESFQVPNQQEKLPELVEKAEVGSFVAAMAEIDRTYDNLKLCSIANWDTPPDHPDLVPVQEALMLKERIREAGRNQAKESDKQFKSWLMETEQIVQRLENMLKNKNNSGADQQFLDLRQACKRCHTKYRYL